MDKIIALCKSRGILVIFFRLWEIYGGTVANTWDYGPLGVEIKE